MSATIRHIFISPGHNFRGRHGGPAGDHHVLECASVESVAGRGIAGDRYFDHKPDFKGQITFFAWENLVRMWDELAVPTDQRNPSATRRNVITEGLDLNALIGREFEIQGLRFLGTEECKPCYWMNQAIHPRSEEWMKGRGGLRAKILLGGRLAVTSLVPGEPLACALMAGGHSTRMGRDKALIEIEALPLWQRQIALLQRMGGPVCVTSPVRPDWLPARIEWVADSPHALGPSGGLLASLEWAQERGAARLLILAVDLPRMTLDVLAELLRACVPGRGVIPQSGPDFEPLAAVYPADAAEVVRSLAVAGERKLQHMAARLVEHGMAAPVRVDAPTAFHNMNTPEDLP